jgi:ribonuclease Z
MTSIEITMLGTTAGVPTPQRNHAAIYFRYKGREEWVGLFDCGEGTQRQIFKAGLNFMRISDIFISHWHADHWAGLVPLVFTMNLENRAEALSVHAPEADKWVGTLISLGYGRLSFAVKERDVNHEGNEIETIMDHPEFTIQATPAKHGVPAVAYAFVEKDRVKLDKEKMKKLGLPEKGRIYQQLKDEGEAVINGKTVKLEDVALVEKGKKIVYSGDTLPHDNIVKLAEGADVLIHDTTFFEERNAQFEYRHATLDEVLKIATKAGVKKLVLTHISRRYQDLEELEKQIKGLPNVVLAKDLMKIEV